VGRTKGETLLNDLLEEGAVQVGGAERLAASDPADHTVLAQSGTASDPAFDSEGAVQATEEWGGGRRRRRRWHIHHRHRPHVHHRHRPHIHHRHRPHIHVSLKKMLSSVGNAFKYLGGKFRDLYNWFKKMFGSAFKFPRLNFKGFARGFMNGVNKIKSHVANLVNRIRGEEMMMLDVGTQFNPMSAGYGIVKSGTQKHTGLLKPIVDHFCNTIHILINPIKRAFNAVVKLITGIIPSWLIKIAKFGGIGFLASFLFSAFTVGGGWAANVGPFSTAFEAGFALELKSNLQIGYTGCYLGGSSGVTQSAGGVSSGIAATAFKKFGNIAGDSATIGIEGDICNLFGLPCKLSLAPSIIFDNSDWSNKNSLALKTFKTCFGRGAEYLTTIQNLELTHEMAVNMVQTLSKEELEANILQAAYNFFKNGFNRLKNCIVSIFKLWIGLALDISAGVDAGSPVKLTFTLDYAYMKQFRG
jgi:hypothetical protein